MRSLNVVNDLAAVFLPIGIVGSGIAVVCAVVAMIAVARGAAGLSGGAVGVWIVGAMLSVASSFASEWMPLAVSGIALAVGLGVGGVIRGLSVARRRQLV